MRWHAVAGVLLLLAAPTFADQKAENARARLNARLSAAKSLTGSMEVLESGRKTGYTFRFLKPNNGRTNQRYLVEVKQYMPTPADRTVMEYPLFGLESFVLFGEIPGKHGAIPQKPAKVGAFSQETFAGKRCNVIPLLFATSYRTCVFQDPKTDLPVGWKVELPKKGPRAKPMVVTAIYKDLKLDAPLDPATFAQ